MTNNNEQVDVLAFGPHPDDVDMGCGGTMIKLKKMGYTTGIIDLTGGEAGTRGSVNIRMREAEEASEILEINFRKNLDLGDGRLWNNDEAREKVVKAIRAHKPRIVISAHWLDDHPDHVQGANLVKDAYYIAGFKNVFPEIEHHRPKAIMYYMCRQEFDPAFIVDITEYFDRKMDAVRAFSSQFFKKDSNEPETPLSMPDFLDVFTIRAKFYGRLIGCKYGEPFFTKNPPPVNDPVSIWF